MVSAAQLTRAWLMRDEVQLQIETPTGGWLVNFLLANRAYKVEPYGNPTEPDFSWSDLGTEATEITTYVDPDEIFGETIDVRKRLHESALRPQERLRLKLREWLANQSCATLLARD